ncbi:hypothetical protein P2318_24220 [Myxococcaceae bacterium GXIMD 01537]
MKNRLAWLAAVALLMSACVAHEKVGDQAAAVGDWKSALASYGTALSNEPDSPVLKDKYLRAKQEAVADAFRRARSCAATGDFSCAVGEADYALQVEPGNMEIASFRVEAARSLALSQVSRAREEAAQGRFRASIDLLERARSLSSDAAVTQAGTQARTELASLAGAEAERLRQQRAFPEALEALSIAAAIEPARRGRLEAMRQEYEQFLDAEAERLALDGDAAMAHGDWAVAAASYENSLKIRPGGRAGPLARYTGGMALGEAALSRRDFATAANGYRQALDSGMDPGGRAAERLAMVEVRPYSVRIRSVLARPMRPDGRPWVGSYHPLLGQLTSLFAGDLLGPHASRSARRAIEMAMMLPPENRPALSVQVALPDGTRLATQPVSGLYATFDAEFIVATNTLDERPLSVRVVHGVGPVYEEVGVVTFPMGELARRREAYLADRSVAQMLLTFEPALQRVDGMFAGMYPLSEGSNYAQDYSQPSPSSAGFRLRSVRVAVPPHALMAEPDEGAAELLVEIVQRGRVVFRSSQVDNRNDAQWTVNNVNLYLETNDPLSVRVWDMDADGQHDLLVDAPFFPNQVAQGTVHATAPNGSSAILQFEARPRWAGDATP